VKLAVFCDLHEEGWASMDLVSDKLVEHARRLPGIEVESVRPRLPERLRGERRGSSGALRSASTAGLAFGRFIAYPPHVLVRRGSFDFFHVADHSYAHLTLLLPAQRCGVYCHDIDAFRPLLPGSTATRVQRSIARLALLGTRRARVVFHSTLAVRSEIVAHGLLPERLLCHAPYGIAEEFSPGASPADTSVPRERPFLLHVGSLIPRKNPDFLLRIFGDLVRARPEFDLVQIGGGWEPAQREFIERHGLAGRVRQIQRFLSRDELAAHYRAAALVVMPSTAEGFGLPVIEALACGAPVLASDLPVLRQVGGEATMFAPVNDADAWRVALLSALAGGGPDRERRLAWAAEYSWARHAKTITDAYRAANVPG
jgi:glycosyltransferase involved in cell wall biosynthesis